MVLNFRVLEQTLTAMPTKSVPRQGSKQYLRLQFSFSADWGNLNKACFLQQGEVSVPLEVTDNYIDVPEYFTEQPSFNCTLFGTSENGTEVPTNTITITLEPSNNLWVSDAPQPTPSWIAELLEINSHPPIPGVNGYWLIWNADTNKYEESTFPLPEISGGGTAARVEGHTLIL